MGTSDVGRSAPRDGPQHNHAKLPSPRCAARAPWAVGRFSTGRRARATRAMGFERSDKYLLKAVPPTCRGIDAVEPQPTTWGGARPALAYNPQYNHAKSALREACSVGGRPTFHEP